ncbi:hypothetical protein M3175_01620 [Robertmurraya korlensis]|uniref:hypothetical protein n=1 Tax=Robertmurraya korlensis TaxID=519977 RepID=UPI00203F7ED4|nr:hypothetical protein [Robertmurraya korlensis]MCM3599414.1 hypothetical protein [Robertmurraya korlensis]
MMYTEQEFKEMAEWRFRECDTVEEAKILLYKTWITGPSIRYYKINEPKLKEIKINTAKAIDEVFTQYNHVLPTHLKEA